MNVGTGVNIFEFNLPINTQTFLDAFWLDTNSLHYTSFLVEKLKDLDVVISDWNQEPLNRKIKSYHPSKVSFPGLPSHAESFKQQIIEYGTNKELIQIKEINNFQGIPYSDYFTVKIEWVVSANNVNNNNHQKISDNVSTKEYINIKIYLDIVFHKYTWLEGTISSNTRSELIEVYSLWKDHAMEYITKHKLLVASSINSPTISALSPPRSRHSNANNIMRTGEDTDDEFFDCRDIEGGGGGGIGGRLRSSSNPDEIRHKMTLDEKERFSQDVASCVQTILVIFEFYLRNVHRFYDQDLVDLMTITPQECFQRILNSFIPTRHASILVAPDIYGPLLAVFSLPQTILLSIGISRHGCSPTALLGNAVAVSLCLWLGLSFLYRTLAFAVSPTIGMRQCLCMVGYSFFSWILALLCSYPLEIYHPTTPPAWPLIIFGLPSAVALGCLFWEHTPASSLTLQSSSLPTSLQHCDRLNRIIQRILWAIPKIMVFLVVTVTHYQFLWYVARSFLPGKKQLCRLTALLQPSRYADILTQKELRKYALLILSGKSRDR